MTVWISTHIENKITLYNYKNYLRGDIHVFLYCEVLSVHTVCLWETLFISICTGKVHPWYPSTKTCQYPTITQHSVSVGETQNRFSVNLKVKLTKGA